MILEIIFSQFLINFQNPSLEERRNVPDENVPDEDVQFKEVLNKILLALSEDPIEGTTEEKNIVDHLPEDIAQILRSLLEAKKRGFKKKEEFQN